MIILDTHVVIWDAFNTNDLTQKATQEIDRAKAMGKILIADISLWEIAMLIKRKRLKIDVKYPEFIRLIMESIPLQIVPISPEIADLSVSFNESINLDHADRLICATSIMESAPLITADNNLRNSKLIHTIW